MKIAVCRLAFPPREALTKTMRVMRLVAIILLGLCLQVAARGVSQTITLSGKNMPLEKVFKEIKRQTGYVVVYNYDLVHNARPVTIHVKNGPLEAFMQLVLQDQPLEFSILNSTISIRAKALPLEVQPAAPPPVDLRGRVTNEDGEPVAGASVMIKGENQGTVTDDNGQYTLRAPGDGILVISYIGYTSVEEKINNRAIIDIQLVSLDRNLGDVVVVGYGTQTKGNLTGSVSTVNSKVLEKVPPVASTTNALAGLVPGLISKQRSGSPGRDGASLNIRGFGDALVIVDGVESGFNNIDQNEIESISVLKDASAAIYGARSGNGVILITTKRGGEGKPTIRLNSSYSFQTITNYPRPMSSGQYAELDRESKTNAGYQENQQRFTPEQIELFYAGTDPNYPNTDWYDLLVRPSAPMQQHNLSISGGSDKIKYFGLFGFMDQETFWKNNGGNFQRFNVRSNIDAKVTDDLSMRIDFSNINEVRRFPARDQNGADTYLWQDFWGTLPIYPAALPDPSKLPYAGSDANGSVYITSNREISGFADNDVQQMKVGAALTYNFPFIKGLSSTAFLNYAQDYGGLRVMDKPVNFYLYDYASDIYTLKGTWSPEAALREQSDKNRIITNQFSFNYENIFGGHHRVSAMALYESIGYSSSWIQANRSHFLTPAIEYLFGGSVKDQFSNGSATEMGRKSYLGRLNYSFRNRYLLEATFRADASARFPSDKRWGYFPSLSAGWRISETELVKDHLYWVDDLKIRAAASNSGYDNVGNFAYLTGYRFGSNYLFGSDIMAGLASTGLANPNLTWEEMSTYNLGLDFSFIKAKLYGVLDVFYRNREGIPATRALSLPTTFGASLPPENLNSRNDRGFEAMLGTRGSKGDLSWDISGNISWAASKWGHYEEPDYSDDPERARVYQISGQWTDRMVGYLTDGLYTSQQEIDAMTFIQDKQDNRTIKPGDIKYIDVNKDGVLDWKDQVDIGKGDVPHYMLGLSSSLRFRNFNLSVLFQGAAGNYINIRLPGSTQHFNERWTETNNNPHALIPRPGSIAQGGGLSDFFLKKAGYIRLKTLNIGYNLPKALLAPAKIQNLYLYFAGFNLVTLDRLKKYGYDPEARSSSGGFEGSSYYYYPQQRTFTFGLNLTL